jgi:tRNA(Ile)-lysidine synthase
MEKELNIIKNKNIIEHNDSIVIAVSGGADSVFLMYMLKSLEQEYNLKLWVLHINHQLRGRESDADEKFVKDQAEKLNIPFISKKINIKGKNGIEEKARNLRYKIFADVCKKVGANKCALGHNADDNAETVLMWILRGTGLNGLSGIPEKRYLDKKIEIIRPIMSFFRKDIEAYLKNKNIKFRIDSTNKKSIYSRNKIRLELMPILETYNKKIKTHLINISKIVNDEKNVLDGFLEDALNKIIIDEKSSEKSNIIIDLKKFLVYNTSIKKLILSHVLRANIEYNHIDSLLKLINAGKNFQVDLPNKLVVYRDYNKLVIMKSFARIEKNTKEALLKLNDITKISNFNFESKIIDKNENLDLKNKNIGFFDWDYLKNKKLYFRFWRKGDVFNPHGLKHTKKLQDFFVDEKISRDLRNRLPIFLADDEILWVSGYRTSDVSKIKKNTKRILRINILG